VRQKTGPFVIASFLIIYFASGFAALLYQVIWQRMLAIFSGTDLFATTTIVASFMAGLGIGSAVAGALADRISFRWLIGLFALAEGLTGIFGELSAWWYYDVLYRQFAQSVTSPPVVAGVLFSSLLIPTFLMGMTLPLLSKALTPAIELAGQRIGSLYALNTLGAAAGALATAWVLMGRFDFQQILRIGVIINFAVAILAVFLGQIVARTRTEAAIPDAPADRSVRETTSYSFPAWLGIYALSGFIALSLEIVWFRILGVMLKSNSFTFPHLLGIYLAGLAGGIFLGTVLVRFTRRAGIVFLVLQAGIMIYAAASIIGLHWGLNYLPLLNWLHGYLAQYETLDVIGARRGFSAWITLSRPHPNFVSLYIVTPLALMAPPTLMMGMAFPFLQKAVQDNRALLGRRVGWLQGANILGSTLGSLVVGMFLLGYLGTSGTLRLLIALGGAFLILAVRQLFPSPSKVRLAACAAAAMAIVILMGVMPGGSRLWARLHGSPRDNVIVSESGSGLAVLKNEDASFAATTMVYANGLGQSWIPYYDINVIHSRLGMLPALIHPNPEEIAVIGLGSGDTAFSLGGRPETKEVVCIEIVESAREVLELLHRKKPYGGLESLLHDSRYRQITGDGRRVLAASQKKYDIIEADALRPTSAFAGNLYSYEYYQLLKSRLKPGGLALTWAPTQRTLETFMKVFPHVLNFDSVVVGSEQPIQFDPETIRARLEHPFTKGYYAKAGLDVKAIVFPFFDRKIETLRVDHKMFSLSDWNTDLFPKDEYPR
jgi:predicted membrane-bound spermidine synthase